MNRSEYIQSVFVKDDPLLEEVLASIQEEGMPEISVSPESGKLLTLLVQISGAKDILEIGALGGYSGICLLRGLRADGHLTSLELEPKHATLAYENLKKAGFGEQVTYYTGDAKSQLQTLSEENKKYDFFFIDADKGGYPTYLDWAIRMAKPGAIIAGDNTFQRDRVLDPNEQSSSTVAIRTFNENMANHPQLESLIIPIGDGITVGRVNG